MLAFNQEKALTISMITNLRVDIRLKLCCRLVTITAVIVMLSPGAWSRLTAAGLFNTPHTPQHYTAGHG